jgi:hypothetical protein
MVGQSQRSQVRRSCISSMADPQALAAKGSSERSKIRQANDAVAIRIEAAVESVN